jgi:hypothetical protein
MVIGTERSVPQTEFEAEAEIGLGTGAIRFSEFIEVFRSLKQ